MPTRMIYSLKDYVRNLEFTYLFTSKSHLCESVARQRRSDWEITLMCERSLNGWHYQLLMIYRVYNVLINIGGIDSPVVLGEFFGSLLCDFILGITRYRILRSLGYIRCLYTLFPSSSTISSSKIQFRRPRRRTSLWRFTNGNPC